MPSCTYSTSWMVLVLLQVARSICAMQCKDKEQKNAREENAELEELAHGSCGPSEALPSRCNKR